MKERMDGRKKKENNVLSKCNVFGRHEKHLLATQTTDNQSSRTFQSVSSSQDKNEKIEELFNCCLGNHRAVKSGMQ